MARRNIRMAQEDYFNSNASGASIIAKVDFEVTSVDLTYDGGQWYCEVEAEAYNSGQLMLSGNATSDAPEDAIDNAVVDCFYNVLDWEFENQTPIDELISEAETWYDENEEYLEASRHARRRFSARLGNPRRRARR